MKREWLNKQDNKRLVLIFAGWGTDARYYSDIQVADWDVLVCSDFDGSESWDFNLTDGYTTIYLYAWSLGVSHASRLLRDVKLTAAFAIAGTESPCNDMYGIPESIFRTTRERLDAPNLERFRRRMFSTRDDYQLKQQLLPQNPDIESLRSQLLAIEKAPQCSPAEFWNRVYIFSDDRIFPAENQRRAWEGHISGCEICERRGAHSADIARIVGNTIPNPAAIGRKFESSLSTYDANASAQRIICRDIARRLAAKTSAKGGRMLEIGQGSGISTVMFAEAVSPSSIVCVDLYSTPQVQVAASTTYIVGDAELWIQTAEAGFDYIVSASSIQWFADLRTALRRFSDLLNPGGVVACSTFAPGNLSEFDALRPSPMRYLSVRQIESMLTEYFDDVEVASDEIRVTFPSAREALLHLRLTGVGGFSSHSLRLPQLLAAVPRDADGNYYLTYRPLYFTARKR